MSGSGEDSTGPPGLPGVVRKDDQIEIPSTLDYLPQVDEFVEKKLTRLGIEKGQVYDIAISVSEVVTNAVVHGNKNDLNKKVRISLKVDSSRVEVTVEDEGAGFDRECVCPPIDNKNLLKEAGRGLLIVDSLMDELDICCSTEGGTQVRIVKVIV
jgi:serine/threonine-protein kinase RsbW